MINIINKQDCCGCSACAERCPHGFITMHSDKEGFLYPHVDMVNCTDCGLCEKVCPILNDNKPVQPNKVYAAFHKDGMIRKSSSSGGVFTAIAEDVISSGGVVFGARFDNEWNVVHSFTETLEGLKAFRGSKYVQSNMGNCYKDIENFLKRGRKVLFTGTPCQIAGLKHFLIQDYDNLLTADTICHGVPSPLVWLLYVESLRSKCGSGKNSVFSLMKNPKITRILFRDKRAGWRKYGFSVWNEELNQRDEARIIPNKHQNRVLFEVQQQNLFLRGFLQELYLRPSCHSCRFRCFKSGSDITMADFWGVEKVFPYSDDKGVSLVLKKCDNLDLPQSLSITELDENSIEIAYRSNKALFVDFKPNVNRDLFFKELQNDDVDICSLIERNTSYSGKQVVHDHLSILLLNLGIFPLIAYLKRLMKKQ